VFARVFVTFTSLRVFTLRGGGGEWRANLSLARRQQGKKVMSNADPRGKFVWHELLSADAAAATAFYTKVVAWKTQPWEQDASYSMWVAKNGPVGGIASPEGAAPPHWLPYIGVNDVTATVETAKGLGGRVLKEKTDLPNGTGCRRLHVA
jgi:predicted enzyme related to lactoylglutathione lyase